MQRHPGKTLKIKHSPRPHTTPTQSGSWVAWDPSQTGLGFAVTCSWAQAPALPPARNVRCQPTRALRPSPAPRTGHSPVMRTSAERHAKAGTSTTRPCRDREKARMLSIQSPKPRAHCSRWSTRPEQKMSFPSAGLDLEGGEAGGGQGGSRAGRAAGAGQGRADGRQLTGRPGGG